MSSLKNSFEKSDDNLKDSEALIQKYTSQLAQITNEQLRANEKLKPLRDKEIEAAAKLNRINLERESLDNEEERIKDTKLNLEQTIKQIISDFEREQFQLKDATKDLEALNLKKNELGSTQDTEFNSETIENEKNQKDNL